MHKQMRDVMNGGKKVKKHLQNKLFTQEVSLGNKS